MWLSSQRAVLALNTLVALSMLVCLCVCTKVYQSEAYSHMKQMNGRIEGDCVCVVRTAARKVNAATDIIGEAPPPNKPTHSHS